VRLNTRWCCWMKFCCCETGEDDRTSLLTEIGSLNKQKKSCLGICSINFYNLLVLSSGFMVLFAAYNSLQNFETSLLPGNLGNESLGVLYGTVCITVFAAPMTVHYLTEKWTMILGGISYVVYMISLVKIIRAVVLVMSIVIGAGAAILWVAQGSFLTKISPEDKRGRNSGIFWGIFQLCNFFGNLAAYFVLKHMSDTALFIMFVIISSVGVAVLLFLRPIEKTQSASFSPIFHSGEGTSSAIHEDIVDPFLDFNINNDHSDGTYQRSSDAIGAEFGSNGIRNPGTDESSSSSSSESEDSHHYNTINNNIHNNNNKNHNKNNNNNKNKDSNNNNNSVKNNIDPSESLADPHIDTVDEKETVLGPWTILKESVKMFFEPSIIFFCPMFFWTGMELAFWTGEFPQMFDKTQIGLVLMFVGLAEVFAGFIVGYVSDFIGRSITVLMGSVLYGVGLTISSLIKYHYLMHPTILTIPISAYFAAFCFGLGDAVFNTQTFSLLGSLFPKKSEGSWTIFQCLQNGGSLFGFFYAIALPFHGHSGTMWQIWIQILMLVVSTVGFIIVDRRLAYVKKNSTVIVIDF